MFRFRHAVPIRRPPRDVFALLTRFEDISKFVPEVVSRGADEPRRATVTVRLRGAARVFEPLLGRYVQRAYARNLDRLRDVLEA